MMPNLNYGVISWLLHPLGAHIGAHLGAHLGAYLYVIITWPLHPLSNRIRSIILKVEFAKIITQIVK